MRAVGSIDTGDVRDHAEAASADRDPAMEGFRPEGLVARHGIFVRQLAWNEISTVGPAPLGDKLQVPSAFWLTTSKSAMGSLTKEESKGAGTNAKRRNVPELSPAPRV
jgi:hypothetical protein